MKVPLLGLTSYISDKIGAFNIVQNNLTIGSNWLIYFLVKPLLGKDIDGKEYIW